MAALDQGNVCITCFEETSPTHPHTPGGPLHIHPRLTELMVELCLKNGEVASPKISSDTSTPSNLSVQPGNKVQF